MEKQELLELMARAMFDLTPVRYDALEMGEQLFIHQQVKAALTALSSAGYVIAPVEPTEAMMKAALEAAILSKGVEMPIPLDLKMRVEKEGIYLEGPVILFTAADEYRAMISAYKREGA